MLTPAYANSTVCRSNESKRTLLHFLVFAIRATMPIPQVHFIRTIKLCQGMTVCTFPSNDNHLRDAGPLLQEFIDTCVDVFRQKRNNGFCGVVYNPFGWSNDSACASGLAHWLLHIFQLHTCHYLNHKNSQLNGAVFLQIH
jgi:hypothetical protein